MKFPRSKQFQLCDEKDTVASLDLRIYHRKSGLNARGSFIDSLLHFVPQQNKQINNASVALLPRSLPQLHLR